VFNGMSGVHHREPGLALAALTDDRLVPTLIADLVHVHPLAIQLVVRAARRVALVSDAVAPGAGTSGGLVIAERDGAVYLSDGTLAGSLLTMHTAFVNVVRLGVPIAHAAAMAATVPCDLIGASDRGRLEPETVADIVAVDPVSLAIRAVWVAGIRVV
jgi:N-acetylglucosamine-6-phosphate deacetylase